ncbi:MAG: hypothetical protein QOJ85_1031 [Solirubrobacteraceae bacterium]|nr:hypothetical protein [Solirubrobacteraceae bacterium]
MLASLHLADVGRLRALAILRRPPAPTRTPGLVYADLLGAARLGAGLLPRPHPGRVALFAVWSDEAALDRFLAADPLAAALAAGPAVRLSPLRTSGSWAGLPALVEDELPVADDEPVAVLTYGRLKLHRVVPFLRASARAEADVVADPALVIGTGLARPPRLVSTFSLWRSAAAMRDFAYRGPGHTGALQAVARRDFHRESIFIRFRPYGATGDWSDLPPSVR